MLGTGGKFVMLSFQPIRAKRMMMMMTIMTIMTIMTMMTMMMMTLCRISFELSEIIDRHMMVGKRVVALTGACGVLCAPTGSS